MRARVGKIIDGNVIEKIMLLLLVTTSLSFPGFYASTLDGVLAAKDRATFPIAAHTAASRSVTVAGPLTHTCGNSDCAKEQGDAITAARAVVDIIASKGDAHIKIQVTM
jgi:hypothetical protein